VTILRRYSQQSYVYRVNHCQHLYIGAPCAGRSKHWSSGKKGGVQWRRQTRYGTPWRPSSNVGGMDARMCAGGRLGRRQKMCTGSLISLRPTSRRTLVVPVPVTVTLEVRMFLREVVTAVPRQEPVTFCLIVQLGEAGRSEQVLLRSYPLRLGADVPYHPAQPRPHRPPPSPLRSSATIRRLRRHSSRWVPLPLPEPALIPQDVPRGLQTRSARAWSLLPRFLPRCRI
jgi:hypothetical protein